LLPLGTIRKEDPFGENSLLKVSKPAAAAAENLDSSVEILENDEDDVQIIDDNCVQKKVLHATDDSTSESDDKNFDQDIDYIPKKFRHDDGTDFTSESDDGYSARKKNFTVIRRSNRKKTYKPPVADSTSESEDE
jgi:hypothetical protein